MSDKPRVLIIDDDEDFLSSFAALLNSWGTIEVITAGDGASALQLINSDGPFHLIFSDYMMPEMDGLTLKEQINENPITKSIPFVVISGYGTPRLLDMAVSRGVEEWYDKPVEVPILQKLLKKYLKI